MNCSRIISCAALAAKLASGRDVNAEPADAPNAVAGKVEAKALLGTTVRLPQVLKKLEPNDNRVVRLPGPPIPKQAPPPAAEAKIVPVVMRPEGVSPAAEVGVPPAGKPSGSNGLAASVARVRTPSYVLPVWHPKGVPALPAAPEIATVRPYPARPFLNALVIGGSTVSPPPMFGPTVPLPAEFAQESAVFCQKRIGQWSLDEARTIFGEPLRQRPAIDDEDSENGHIFAFRDPTGRYKEVELDFGNENGALRTVFVYPWNLTWLECRRLWGAKVSATEGNKGRMFYSYVTRHLDVLVDRDGKVISLGLY